jgi:murein DD-endopeptidase MepM/ murein hydrolase activator NlpD
MKIKLTEQQIGQLINKFTGLPIEDLDIEKTAPDLVKMWKELADNPVTNAVDTGKKVYDKARDVVKNALGKKGTNSTTNTAPAANTAAANAQMGPNIPTGNEMYHPLGHVAMINSPYGQRDAPRDPISNKPGTTDHKGVDIACKSGSPVYSPLDGVVITAGDTGTNPCGGEVKIDHFKLVTKFCHLSEILVTVRQQVKKGQLIGKSGGGKFDKMRGTTTGEHLHYEILNKNGSPYNPTEIQPNLTA